MTKKTVLGWVSAFLFGAVIMVPSGAIAQTLRAAGDFLQIGDVKTTHILNATILDVDISTSSAIQSAKVRVLGSNGEVHFTSGNKIATSSNLLYDAANNILYVFGGKLSATSTNFNGVNLTWPSTAGSSGQNLQTDGAGTLSWASSASSYITASLPAGETLTAGDSLFIATSSTDSYTSLTFSTAGAINALVGDTTQQKWAMAFTETAVLCFGLLSVDLATNGAPADSLQVTIEADSAGAPSGVALATATIAAGSLTGSQTTYTLTLNQDVCAGSGNQKWIVFARTGALNGSNNYQLFIDNAQPYANGIMYKYNGSAWASDVYDLRGKLYTKYIPGTVYRATALLESNIGNFVGFASANTTASTTATVYVGGTASGLASLSPGKGYYLTTTLGGISLTAAAQVQKVCLALSATTCLITNIW